MGIKEKVLKLLQKNGIATKLSISQATGSTNGGEYISRLRKDYIIDCIMATNSVTGRRYGIYVLKGKR